MRFFLCVEDPEAGNDGVKEGAVVADQQHGAGVVRQHFFEQFEGFDVQIVGRLVKDEDVRRLAKRRASRRRARSPPESARPGCASVRAGRGNLAGRRRCVCGYRPLRRNRVRRRRCRAGFVRVKLGTQLVEVGDFQFGAVFDVAAGGREVAEQQAQQGGFARAIRADEADFFAAFDDVAEVLVPAARRRGGRS